MISTSSAHLQFLVNKPEHGETLSHNFCSCKGTQIKNRKKPNQRTNPIIKIKVPRGLGSQAKAGTFLMIFNINISI